MEFPELPDPESLLRLVPSDEVDFHAFLEECLSGRQDGHMQVKEGHHCNQSQQEPHQLQQPVRQLSCSLDAPVCTQPAGQQPAVPDAAACEITNLAHYSQWGLGEAVQRCGSLPVGIPAHAVEQYSQQQHMLQQLSLPVPAAGKLGCKACPHLGPMASSSSGVQVLAAHRGAAVAAQCAGISPVALSSAAPFSTAAPVATVHLRPPAAMPAACPSGMAPAPAASSIFSPRPLAPSAAPSAPPASAVGLCWGLQAAPSAVRISSAAELCAVQATRTIARALSASTLGPIKQPFKKSRKPNKVDDLEAKVFQAQAVNKTLKLQLHELHKEKRELAMQLSTKQLELNMLQDSNRHLKENICQNRAAVAALTNQLQSKCQVNDASSCQQLLGAVPLQVMHMTGPGLAAT